MAEPSVEAALRQSQRMVNGEPSNLRDAILADYGVDIDARPAQYVSRSEYGYGPGQLPAVRAAGAHYSAPGAREGYEAYNLPPVMYQRNPFATAAYRTFVDPYGQMSVQPLVGFPSAYPHVLSGVPTNPFNVFGMLQQMPMPFMAPWMMGGMGMMGGVPPRAPQGGGGSRSAGTPPNTNQPNYLPAKEPPLVPPATDEWVHYGNARARADAMPVSSENLAWMNSLARQAQAPVTAPGAYIGPFGPVGPHSAAPSVSQTPKLMGPFGPVDVNSSAYQAPTVAEEIVPPAPVQMPEGVGPFGPINYDTSEPQSPIPIGPFGPVLPTPIVEPIPDYMPDVS